MAYPSTSANRPVGSFAPAQKPTAEPLPKNYVDEAENLMRAKTVRITTSKLRNLFSLLTEPYNEALRSESALNDAQKAALQAARIRMVYECARDQGVKTFAERTKLLSYLLDVGDSRQKLMDYYHYMEALVAYARYYGVTDEGR